MQLKNDEMLLLKISKAFFKKHLSLFLF